MSIRNVSIFVAAFAVVLSGCSVSLAGLTALDQTRERSASQVRAEHLDQFEPGAEVVIRTTSGFTFEGTYLGASEPFSDGEILVSQNGNRQSINRDLIEWVRPQQSSNVIQAFLMGAFVDAVVYWWVRTQWSPF